MIPILYKKNDELLTGSGVGFLRDTIKCTVTEERNGAYELEMQYPTSGVWFSELCEGALIKAKPNDTSAPQYFRIYKITRPIDRKVKCYAEHTSYDLTGYPLAGFTVIDATPAQAINKALSESGAPTEFAAESDIDTVNHTSTAKPCSVRALLGGQSGSILDVWGGEYEFDNFTIKLHRHRGKDTGVVIRYGKNLKNLQQESNISKCYTHILPYAVVQDASGTAGAETYIYLAGEKTLQIAEQTAIGRKRVYLADLTDRFAEGETIDEATLRIKATAYAETCSLNVPKISLTVDFVPLWQTEDYKDIAPLERVSLCDEVSVMFPELGVTAKSKVIKTVYDVLKERYEKIELGDAKSNFAKTASQLNNTVHTMGNYLYQTFASANGVLTSQIRLLSSAAEYTVGEKSPSDGLVAGAVSTLKNGMIYVPVDTHEEGAFVFEVGTAYSWNSGEGRWDELRAVSVDKLPDLPENGSLAYFSADASPYKAGYLYMYDAIGRTWVPVASTYDDYQTIALSLLQQTIDSIKARLTDAEGNIASVETTAKQINSRVENNAGTLTELAQNAQDVNLKIVEILETGVSQVTTSTGYKFDAEGLSISREGDEIANTINHKGMEVKRGEESILTANTDGVNALNLTARQYLTIGKNSRFEDYQGNRTACFYIGGSDD